MKIRILQPTFVRLSLRPGDEIAVSDLTPELRSLLANVRVDGQRVAVVDGEQVASVTRGHETATTRSGRASGRSAAAVA